jgi:hypothetical protein
VPILTEKLWVIVWAVVRPAGPNLARFRIAPPSAINDLPIPMFQVPARRRSSEPFLQFRKSISAQFQCTRLPSFAPLCARDFGHSQLTLSQSVAVFADVELCMSVLADEFGISVARDYFRIVCHSAMERFGDARYRRCRRKWLSSSFRCGAFWCSCCTVPRPGEACL